MRKFPLVLIIVSFIFFLGAKDSYAFAKGEQGCIKCHTLNAEQAKKILSGMIPDIKILNVGEGPVSGIWEVGFESRGKKGIVYLDYLFENIIAGNIVSIKTKVNLTQESFSEINRVDLSLISYENALVLGDKNAKHRIVVFDDPD